MEQLSSFQNPLIPDMGERPPVDQIFPATPEKMLDCGYQAFYGEIEAAGVHIMVRKKLKEKIIFTFKDNGTKYIPLFKNIYVNPYKPWNG